MNLFKKKVPTQLKDHLTKGERVIAWTNHSGGLIAVTDLALLSFDHHENVRIPWELTISGKWEEPLLVISLQSELGGPVIQRAWNLGEPGLVPDAVRERITTAQVFDQLQDVKNVGKVRFIARRSPDGISWDYLANGNLGLDSQTHIQDQLNKLRQTLGI